MRKIFVAVLVTACVALAGCAGEPADVTSSTPGTSPATGTDVAPTAPMSAPATALVFSQPIRINPHENGYEPTLDIGPDGTLYVSAAKGLATSDDGGLATFTWYSKDGGASWTVLPSMTRDRFYSIEGDMAVDAGGTAYYVDTYGPDNIITRWNAQQEWIDTRPVQGTLIPFDDRPWLVARGLGELYYGGFQFAPFPGFENVRNEQDPAWGQWSLYRSTDGGQTWDLGRVFPRSGTCIPGLSAAPSGPIWVVCRGVDTTTGRIVWESRDDGESWQQILAERSAPSSPSFPYPQVAFDGRGVGHAAWIQKHPDSDGSQILVSSHRNGSWDTWVAVETPALIYDFWMAAHEDDSLGFAYQVSEGPVVRNCTQAGCVLSQDTAWHVDALLVRGEDIAGARVTQEPTRVYSRPPEDFLAAAFDEEGSLHIVYAKSPPDPGPVSTTRSNGPSHVLHAVGSLAVSAEQTGPL